MRKVKREEMERLSREAKEEDTSREKREVEGEREGVEARDHFSLSVFVWCLF